MRWQDILPKDAVSIDCTARPDLNPPKNEIGEVCPWPWDPQQLGGAPLGQYHCPYCNAMCCAGIEHLDYSDWVDGEPPETAKPRCPECRCDPTLCEADDSGSHCEERSCGTCLHGCPLDDECPVCGVA